MLTLTAISLLKFWLAVDLPLFGDEAFYWWESTQLAPAYDDVPAATAWLIAGSTALLGHHTWAVRLPFLLLALVSWGVLVASAREVAGKQAAVWAGWLGALLPLFAANGLLALPDVPLNLALLLCLYGLQRALRQAAAAELWLAAGLALGFLSHYRFLVPLLAAALWLLVSRDGRALLTRPRLLFSAVLASVIGLAPLLWQQWQSQAAGLSFQFSERHPWSFQIEHLLDPLAQALITSPILYVVLVLAGLLGLRSQLTAVRMYAALGLLLLLVYWLLGAFADAERSRMHWPLPGYLALIVPLATRWSESVTVWRRWRAPALCLAGLFLLLAVSYLQWVARAPEHLVRWQLYPSNFSGAEGIVQEVGQHLQGMPPDTLIVADQFMLAAQLQFALPDRRVFSLDHPLNAKHGRRTVLAALKRDQLTLAAERVGHDLLLVSELSATRLRQRPEHYRRLCQEFPAARQVGDRWVDHGSKRYLLWQVEAEAASEHNCLPPPLAYVGLPQWNAKLGATASLIGWAIRDWRGIEALRAQAGEQELPLQYGQPLPSLSEILPGLDDPNHPHLGFEVSLAGLPAGAHWVQLQARDPALGWIVVAEWPVRIKRE
ncbi:ArnT family glycosyltransferase [Pseudomarimonas arenosa]|uniref:Glycosyltransferase family 39 protein n=1 Tax=Pseudomarimonas arenosa TaxID=2774145 RepID=A0AAW3ZF67_9GAMM|nr:glycosyltransferase family 39 protein [Pseudomarimonas arenosa]MBD8524793.1 glycosyltransferase family 39 protein [Pseudomarimonas arenosa]